MDCAEIRGERTILVFGVTPREETAAAYIRSMLPEIATEKIPAVWFLTSRAKLKNIPVKQRRKNLQYDASVQGG